MSTRVLLLRDELQYQTARINRENELMKQYNNQGITSNYPQYTTNFWGSSADNNYGFGTSNIGNNIESRQQTASQLQTKFFMRTHIILMKYKAKSFILLLNYNKEKLFYATTFIAQYSYCWSGLWLNGYGVPFDVFRFTVL
ncbi:MAG: hypothetical protein IJ545_00940 [Alphaproteobacteria bacterium]|nr:hypothetical protein [Alphaproteobacteria bacterium]